MTPLQKAPGAREGPGGTDPVLADGFGRLPLLVVDELLALLGPFLALAPGLVHAPFRAADQLAGVFLGVLAQLLELLARAPARLGGVEQGDSRAQYRAAQKGQEHRA